MIYLNNAATSWPKPEEVYQAVDACLRHLAGNPGRGGYSAEYQAGRVLYEAREELANMFGVADPSRIVFTHNATDALNMALFGYLRPGDKVVTTSMEHNAVARPLRQLETMGVDLTIVPCDQTGQLDLAAMAAALREGVRAVIMCHASNVTGTIMPVAAVGELAARCGAALIVDAAQTAGVEEIDVAAQNIAMLAFTGHKSLLGPQGTGGLYIREDIDLVPLRYGGTGSLSELDQQPEFLPDRLESGTPNTPGVAGLAAGVRFIRRVGREVIRAREGQLIEALLGGLAAIPGVTVYGPRQTAKQTAVVSFTVDGQDSGEVAYRLENEYGIICRAGLHCAPWAHQTIGTIKTGTVRFSPGYFTTEQEIEDALRAVRKVAAKG
ncbi:cysteine desulfurase family protein [Thermosinus carboxydivorans Nor1]|uniref:cysteine desulfurase n=1 Tax=Thermosinus carboxydivorans Nor1 TaxID=401526 RepID=A1HSN2_9FIRM|nr:aminotransferase class V-fold PLP-dependent enzyme [Thermosinus carboxydivorans]EAX47001.1 cysteine desulfurase family protein [Thermosinus carboxydivorans Nor1]